MVTISPRGILEPEGAPGGGAALIVYLGVEVPLAAAVPVDTDVPYSMMGEGYI